ncbi:MAG: PD-(D/E)XK nuclease family protein [Bryobacteraceae bacterium]
MAEQKRGLRFSGSTVKSWFQYRCDRKTRYETLSPDERAAIPVLQKLQPSAWAQFGVDFELKVLKRLQGTGASVYVPFNGQPTHDELTTLPFLRAARPEEYAYQLRLDTSPWLEQELGLDTGSTRILNGFPDLIRLEREDGLPLFELTDIKATHVATPFHKVQVAFYGLMLQGMLHQLGLPGSIAETAYIWRLKDEDDGSGGAIEADPFALASYTELVKDFFRRKAAFLRDVEVGPGRDDTFFHLYYKCEQCAYLEHCLKSISQSDPNERDVSAVPGLSHDSKRTLWSAGIRTVRDLAAVRNLKAVNRTESWSLQSKAEVLIARANAIASGTVSRHSNAYSLQMPPRVDVAVILLADYDPVGGDLISLGYLRMQGDDRSELIEILPSGRRKDEADAIKRILGATLDALTAVDRTNASGGESPLHAHIFVYEPAEAQYLREAIGRHLDDAGVRSGLMNMIRIFPPDQAVPEPEFRGMHHLPASAIRNVLEQLYALPVSVSYDLRQVSQALGVANPAPRERYQPEPGFERHFSSMLPIEITRALRRGEAAVESVRVDVRARLRATASLVEWLLGENSRAATPFLRLKKKPFRFQGKFDPLAATDIDVLQAYALLENRSGLLERIVALAQPANRRRDRLKCFAGLKLQRHWRFGNRHKIVFEIPFDSRQAELSAESFGVILTQDDPDILLDPGRWPDHIVRIEDVRLEAGNATVGVTTGHARFEQHCEPLIRRDPNALWFLDEIFSDPNTPRMLDFLRFISHDEVAK